MASGQQYDNNMQGVLFKNDRKEKDTDPDYNGNAEVEHVEYWLSAWIKTSTKDPTKKFMRLSFRPKAAAQGGGGGSTVVTAQTQQASTVDLTPPGDDDIPF